MENMTEISEWFGSLTTIEQEALLDEIVGGMENHWPTELVNRMTNKPYRPHHDEEWEFITDTETRFWYVQGGEGSGKTVAGIRKVLHRLEWGCSGAMVSSDLEHFKKSTWAEFRRWCPPDVLIPKHQGRLDSSWEPVSTFTLLFRNRIGGISFLVCGGIKESEATSWEGPNLNFAYWDEARKHKTPTALKVLVGRCRLTMNDIPPQLFITSTPKKHWLFDYFGPMLPNDPQSAFKQRSRVLRLNVRDNEDNLDPDYVEARASVLTGAEEKVYVDADWYDEDEADKFVNIASWDRCKDIVPPLTSDDTIIVALDGAKGGTTRNADYFAMVAMSKDPANDRRAMIRYVQGWQPLPGQEIDWSLIEEEIHRLSNHYNILKWTYDPYQLSKLAHDMMLAGTGWWDEFGQGTLRGKADTMLQQYILSRRIVHDGNESLRQHIDNAYVVTDRDGHKRIVKHKQGEKIDFAVATSMCLQQVMFYNV